jgi:hypothetical protein
MESALVQGYYAVLSAPHAEFCSKTEYSWVWAIGLKIFCHLAIKQMMLFTGQKTTPMKTLS